MWLKSVSQKSESTPALTFSRYLLVSTLYPRLDVDLGRRGNMLGCCNQTCGTVQNKQRASRGPVQNIEHWTPSFTQCYCIHARADPTICPCDFSSEIVHMNCSCSCRETLEWLEEPLWIRAPAPLTYEYGLQCTEYGVQQELHNPLLIKLYGVSLHV